MSGEVAGTAVLAGGGAQSGAAMSLWLASRTWPGGTPPAFNAAPPAGVADYGPFTSGNTYGGPGMFSFTGVTDGDYYIQASYLGNNYWTGPVSVVEDADVLHKAGAEAATGAKTFSGGLTVTGAITVAAGTLSVSALTGVLPVANGGTGSATQNFVDLTSNQIKAGVLTLSAAPVLNGGLTVAAGAVSFPNGSIAQTALVGGVVSGAAVDTTSAQTITGVKTLYNDLPLTGGQLLGSALATPTAPTVTVNGAAGATTYQYQVVATTYDGRDGLPSPTGQTVTGNAALGGANTNGLSWAGVAGAASYRLLRWNGAAWQKLVSGLAGTTYIDNGSAAPTAYVVATSNPGGEVVAATVAANFNAGGITVGRYLGSTAGVAPTGGPYNTGDWTFDSTYPGVRWLCTAGGSPGTWKATGTGWVFDYTKTGGNQALTAATLTVVTFNNMIDDPASLWTTSNTFTVPVGGGGTWAFDGEASVTTNTAGASMTMDVFKNAGGTALRRTDQFANAAAGAAYGLSCTCQISGLVAGDTLQWKAYVTAGTTITIDVTNVFTTWLTGRYVSAS